MKSLIFSSVLLILYSTTKGQDILFPDDEEISHVSGGNRTTALITERIPVSIPDHCPKNMLVYPGDGTNSAWVCDCRPRFLYFPLTDACHEAYRQGPCEPQNYVVLPEGEAVPKCVKNPCLEDGMVQYNNTCYYLRTNGGPCAPKGILGVNETTFQLECIPKEIAPFIIIQAPKRQSPCPVGSRRNSLGMCKMPI